jgi:hypothetical protein
LTSFFSSATIIFMPKKSTTAQKSTTAKKPPQQTTKKTPQKKTPAKKKVITSSAEKRSNVIGVILIVAAIVLTVGAVVNASLKQTSSARAGTDEALIIAPEKACTIEAYEERTMSETLPACDLMERSTIEIQSETMCEVSCSAGKEKCQLAYEMQMDVVQDTDAEGLIAGRGYVACQE